MLGDETVSTPNTACVYVASSEETCHGVPTPVVNLSGWMWHEVDESSEEGRALLELDFDKPFAARRIAIDVGDGLRETDVLRRSRPPRR